MIKLIVLVHFTYMNLCQDPIAGPSMMEFFALVGVPQLTEEAFASVFAPYVALLYLFGYCGLFFNGFT